MANIGNANISKIRLTETTAPASPAAGYGFFYYESGSLKLKKSDGSVITLGTAGSAVASDAIWDAKGDSVWGTGNDAAARLAVGTNGQRPEADSTQTTGIKWSDAGGQELTGGYAEITAAVSTTSTTAVDMTGLSVTVTVRSRPVWITIYVPQVNHSVANGRAVIELYDNTAAAVLQLAIVAQNDTGGLMANYIHLAHRHAPAAGSRTYKARMRVIEAGTGTFDAAATRPAFIRVAEG